jgi:thioredoxin 1
MRILEFWAPWCSTCKVSQASIASLRLTGDLAVEEINIDDNPQLATQYSIRSVPTMIAINAEGEVIASHSGPQTVTQMMQFLSSISQTE